MSKLPPTTCLLGKKNIFRSSQLQLSSWCTQLQVSAVGKRLQLTRPKTHSFARGSRQLRQPAETQENLSSTLAAKHAIILARALQHSGGPVDALLEVELSRARNGWRNQCLVVLYPLKCADHMQPQRKREERRCVLDPRPARTSRTSRTTPLRVFSSGAFLCSLLSSAFKVTNECFGCIRTIS